MTDERTRCEVPFCTRSKKGLWAWWLCGEHVKGVSMHARARHRRAKDFCKKRGWIAQGKGWWRPTTARARRIMDAAGRIYVRSAIKRATGL